MHSSTKPRMADKPATIADLFSKCSELAAQEEKEMGRVVSTMLPVLAYVNEPIMLHLVSLGDSFGELRSASLHSGAVVVTTDIEGKVSSKPLANFRTAECLAILRDSFPVIQRLVADKKHAALAKPTLSMKVFLGGQRFILDTRSYRLLVSNSGGACTGLRVSMQLPDGRTRSCRQLDLNRGERAEVDLGVFKEVGDLKQLELQFDCKDEDKRELHGGGSIPLKGTALQEVVLSRKS